MFSFQFTVCLLLLPASNFILFLILRHRYGKKNAATYQNLLQILDHAISGSCQDMGMVYDESMDAAIASRLNRLLKIHSMHRQNAEKERDMVKALISNISHQIRTPLTNIMLYTGLLKEQPLNPDAMRLVGRLERQSGKLDFFMKELVKSSYAEQEMIILHPEKTNILEIIRIACQTMELAAMKKGIGLEICAWEAPGQEQAEEMFCYADKKWTVEAVSNVLENAVKYSPENSTVYVRIIPYESFLCIQISDSGMGIREAEQGLVFERFYRSKDVKHITGFGIGLYLVREVLSRQGGFARIHSVYGKGTSIQLFLSRSIPANVMSCQKLSPVYTRECQ